MLKSFVVGRSIESSRLWTAACCGCFEFSFRCHVKISGFVRLFRRYCQPKPVETFNCQ
jgi:hypothetical protein